MQANIDQSLAEVKKAIEALNHLFEQNLMRLRLEEEDDEDLSSLEKGLLAMKDAGRIYLSWTDHYIERMSALEGLDSLND